MSVDEFANNIRQFLEGAIFTGKDETDKVLFELKMIQLKKKFNKFLHYKIKKSNTPEEQMKILNRISEKLQTENLENLSEDNFKKILYESMDSRFTEDDQKLLDALKNRISIGLESIKKNIEDVLDYEFYGEYDDNAIKIDFLIKISDIINKKIKDINDLVPTEEPQQKTTFYIDEVPMALNPSQKAKSIGGSRNKKMRFIKRKTHKKY
jgi:uncharacterized membrane protein YheB (UPF0754 family)